METCSYCEKEAHGTCSWPVEQFVEAELSDVKVGDTVARWPRDERKTSGVAMVQDYHGMGGGIMRIELRIKYPGRPFRTKTFDGNHFSRIRVLRMAPCGLAVCEAHLQARGPGVYVCRDHFFAWEKIA